MPAPALIPLIMLGNVVVRAAPRVATYLMKNFGARKAGSSAVKQAGTKIKNVTNRAEADAVIKSQKDKNLKLVQKEMRRKGRQQGRTSTTSNRDTGGVRKSSSNGPKDTGGVGKVSKGPGTSAATRAGRTDKTSKGPAAAVKKGAAGSKLARNLILGGSAVASLPFLLPKSSGIKKDRNNTIKKGSVNKTSSSVGQGKKKKSVNGTTSAQKDTNANRNNKKGTFRDHTEEELVKAAAKNKAKKKKAAPKKKKSKETLFEYITSGTGPRKETTVALYKGGPDVTIDSSKDAYAGYDTLAKKGGSIKKSMKKAKAKGKKRPSLRGWGAAKRGY